MTQETPSDTAAEALFELDDATREATKPLRHNPAVKAIGVFSDIGDQLPLRLISGGVLITGLVRGDPRMIRAAMRMLIAHELATAAKNAVKQRVDRSRPRSAVGRDGHRPKPGRRTHKEETSFPSGHSAGAMAVASALAAEYPRYRAPAMLVAGSVALAQIPRCAHYPTDVGAGVAIGAGANWVAGGLMRAALWLGGLLLRPSVIAQSEPRAPEDVSLAERDRG